MKLQVLKRNSMRFAAAILIALASFGRRSERSSGRLTPAIMIKRRASTD